MKKTADFTLIELVIVIVILGILGAVAAPKFINLQGDAYGANVNALKGSLQSAATLGNTKAILNGYDADEKAFADGDDNLKKLAATSATAVTFAWGFPTADKNGIIKMLQDSGSFGEVADIGKANVNYIISSAAGVLTIKPKQRNDVDAVATADSEKGCFVNYIQPTKKGETATIISVTEGC